jgi:hypothetical protein
MDYDDEFPHFPLLFDSPDAIGDFPSYLEGRGGMENEVRNSNG